MLDEHGAGVVRMDDDESLRVLSVHTENGWRDVDRSILTEKVTRRLLIRPEGETSNADLDAEGRLLRRPLRRPVADRPPPQRESFIDSMPPSREVVGRFDPPLPESELPVVAQNCGFWKDTGRALEIAALRPRARVEGGGGATGGVFRVELSGLSGSRPCMVVTGARGTLFVVACDPGADGDVGIVRWHPPEKLAGLVHQSADECEFGALPVFVESPGAPPSKVVVGLRLPGGYEIAREPILAMSDRFLAKQRAARERHSKLGTSR